jgi:manganese transport protein
MGPPPHETIVSAQPRFSLPESYGSIAVPAQAGWLRKLVSFLGPGWLVAVGYMDPGNWATDIAAGSAFGYQLLVVVLLSNIMAILLQILAVRLGVATGRDLAQACRERTSRPMGLFLWAMAELAIIATDLAEVIGTAIALQLLFGMPLFWGVCLTVLDVFVILLLQRNGFRNIEAMIAGLILLTAACFAFQLVLAQPVLGDLLAGFAPTTDIIANSDMLYLSMGIIGATVMPHNLYLHSSIVQTRRFGRSAGDKREAIRFASIDSTVSLLLAFFLNAGILVLAASTFHANGIDQVASIEEAHGLLAPLLGVPLAAIAFGIALLATGQSSAITATLAGQIVMEGFLRIRLPAWARRVLTRAVAIMPALFIIGYYGADQATGLLVFSQVVLSLQLPFAVIPLVRFTSSRQYMGAAASPLWLTVACTAVAAVLVGLNLKLLADILLQ